VRRPAWSVFGGSQFLEMFPECLACRIIIVFLPWLSCRSNLNLGTRASAWALVVDILSCCIVNGEKVFTIVQPLIIVFGGCHSIAA
jgi:hypothetical protein